MTQTIQKYIDDITLECSSIYAKEDVIKILTNLKSNPQEDSSLNEFLNEFLNKLVDRFKEKLDIIDSTFVVSYDSAEFRIEGTNEIVLDYITVKEDNICDLLKQSITEAKQS